jgi:phospholipid/cholesterol/gamma-HCH transport system permease protein
VSAKPSESSGPPPSEAPRARRAWAALGRAPFEAVGAGVIGLFREVGETALLGLSVLLWAARPPLRVGLFLQQCDFIGVGSLFIVLLTGLFTGLVFALQSSFAFATFNAESLVGATVVISLTRELSPVLAGLMVTGRAGSAIATELGTMRVSEQIDALSTMAVSPIQYLAVPRVLAMTAVMPLLTMLFNMVGFLGAFIVSVYQAGIDRGTFMGRIHQYVQLQDVLGGLFKSAVFGFVIALIACQKGMNASGGSRGVGLAATQTVVSGSVIVLVLDYVLTTIILEIQQGTSF